MYPGKQENTSVNDNVVLCLLQGSNSDKENSVIITSNTVCRALQSFLALISTAQQCYRSDNKVRHCITSIIP